MIQDYYSGEPMRIGLRRQILFDNAIVEDSFGITRRQVPPLKYPGNPVLLPDKPWENNFAFLPKVLYDDACGLYRMWYYSFDLDAYHRVDRPGEKPPTGPYFMLYAESPDGYNWTKPLFDHIRYGPYDKTNIVMVGDRACQGGDVFTDPCDRDPAHKFKLIYVDRGVCLAFSPDGIHWTPYEKNPLIRYHSDCHNHVVYNEKRGVWQLLMRPVIFAGGKMEGAADPKLRVRHMRRRVAVAESPDLYTWSRVRCVYFPDELDVPDFDAISMFAYEGKFIGALDLFDGDNNIGGHQWTRNQFIYSDDLNRFERLPGRPEYLKTGVPGSFDDKALSAPSPFVRINNQLAMYYGGRTWNDDSPSGESVMSIGMAFVSDGQLVEMYGSERGGYLLTKEFVLEGNQLEINCRRSFGDPSQIRVEITEYPLEDPSGGGHAIEGFSLPDCEIIRASVYKKVVTWKSGWSLESLRGRRIYLRFEIINAGLYSFQINDITV